MFSHLSLNNVKKGGQEESVEGWNQGPKFERQEVLTDFNFVILKTSQKFILKELLRVRKEQYDTKA